ncbi:nucleoside-diphosphate-sugar epimerase [Hungatella effluvii]|uniref:Nucleoside-diphosphate-sugar epimerase n=1 Tax=Hungatella effluvii TaxID=1096246 RepID=A0A2V3YBF4_9FIRM|nr:NAD(P)-dependent oxidoreductase [Hungatella effluvii]PXX48902.1 nucleoside-diphosphate-sugar epimerase [Hungatella effluvii]
MENIVITGATGFLGSHLAQWFLEQGDRVYALVRPGSAKLQYLPEHRNLIPVYGTMEEAADCVEEIGHADAWFHFAWGGVNREEIDSPEVQAGNIRGSLACVEAAHRLGCRVFMDAGSRVEYGVIEDGRGVMTEEMECSPVNEYGKAKLEFFRQAVPVCEKYGMNFCHLRFFSVYGYGDHPWSIISTLVRELPRGGRVSLSACRHEWNFMYIDDAVEAVGRLYEQVKDKPCKNGVAVNIASRDTRVLKSFVEEVFELAGKRGTLEFGTFVQAKEGALSIRPDVSRMEAMTGGFKERYTFGRGITEMIKREMEHQDEEN